MIDFIITLVSFKVVSKSLILKDFSFKLSKRVAKNENYETR